MYCKNCGSPNDDNSRFCSKCGTAMQAQSFAPAGMSKKEYFDSPYSGEKSKKFFVASKILIGVLAFCVALSVFTYISAIGIINALLDDPNISVAELMEKLEKLDVDTSDLTSDDIDSLENLELKEYEEEFQNQFGFSFISIIETTFYTVFAMAIVGSILMLLFAVLGVAKLKKGFAVTALVFSILCSGSWVSIGITIALLVLVNMLNKEYDSYSMSVFTPITNENEPYFGA